MGCKKLETIRFDLSLAVPAVRRDPDDAPPEDGGAFNIRLRRVVGITVCGVCPTERQRQLCIQLQGTEIVRRQRGFSSSPTMMVLSSIAIAAEASQMPGKANIWAFTEQTPAIQNGKNSAIRRIVISSPLSRAVMRARAQVPGNR